MNKADHLAILHSLDQAIDIFEQPGRYLGANEREIYEKLLAVREGVLACLPLNFENAKSPLPPQSNDSADGPFTSRPTRS